MMLESDCQPMGRRASQAGRGDQPSQRGWTGLQRAEDLGGFVQNADTASVVHALILPSRMLECKFGKPTKERPPAAMGKTLSEKIWDDHVVRSAEGEPDLLFIDLHLVHEVTSPQAFDGLRQSGRRVRRPDLTLADGGPQHARR